MTTTELRKKFERLKGSYSKTRKDIAKGKEVLKSTKKSLKRHEKAKEILRQVGLQTQNQLQYHISDITSMALDSVFEDAYQLVLNFESRRNKTECDILFSRGEELIDPLSASGGGAVDVASFALRIASWSMESPRKRNVMILDEPMRFVSEGLKDKVSLMLKEVSEKLGIQFIIITHEPKLATWADKVFEVTNHKGISRVSEA